MTQYNEFPNIMQRLSTLTRRVRDQETAPRLYSAGIGSGGIRIYGGGSLSVRDGGDINILSGGRVNVENNGSINILSGGRIVSDGSANFSGSAQLKGDTTIAGNLSIQGTLSFPNGSIEGRFLSHQFYSQSVNEQARAFTATFTGFKTLVNETVSVPSWATDMYVMMNAVGYISNTEYHGSRSAVIRCFADTQDSVGGLMVMYSAGSSLPAVGQVNAIKHVNVSSKSSVKVGAKIYNPNPASGAVGNAFFYSSIIFVRQ